MHVYTGFRQGIIKGLYISFFSVIVLDCEDIINWPKWLFNSKTVISQGMLKLIIIYPDGLRRLPLYELLVVEPEPDLPAPVLRAVAAVNDVPAGPQPKVSADGPGRRVLRVGDAKHLPTDGDDVVALPGHGNHRPGLDVRHQPRVEWPLLDNILL